MKPKNLNFPDPIYEAVLAKSMQENRSFANMVYECCRRQCAIPVDQADIRPMGRPGANKKSEKETADYITRVRADDRFFPKLMRYQDAGGQDGADDANVVAVFEWDESLVPHNLAPGDLRIPGSPIANPEYYPTQTAADAPEEVLEADPANSESDPLPQ